MMSRNLRICLVAAPALFILLLSATDARAQVTATESNSLNLNQCGIMNMQLPTFSFTTVTTTVSVPDGGTVLLGGIKGLREGRNGIFGGSTGSPAGGNLVNAQGSPILSKLPYISRLFKNVGVSRDTESLMMMVTPRIIIQEEEE